MSLSFTTWVPLAVPTIGSEEYLTPATNGFMIQLINDTLSDALSKILINQQPTGIMREANLEKSPGDLMTNFWVKNGDAPATDFGFNTQRKYGIYFTALPVQDSILPADQTQSTAGSTEDDPYMPGTSVSCPIQFRIVGTELGKLYLQKQTEEGEPWETIVKFG